MFAAFTRVPLFAQTTPQTPRTITTKINSFFFIVDLSLFPHAVKVTGGVAVVIRACIQAADSMLD